MKLRIALFVAAASGFIALSYEILWYRLYSYVSWGAPSAFGSLLGFYLLGIAVGSLASRKYCKDHPAAADVPTRKVATTARASTDELRMVARFVFLANLVGFLVAPALGWVVTHAHWFLSLSVVGLATCLLGAVLPLVAHFGIAPDERAGARLSYVYLANIIGSASGSLLTGFVAMDAMSTRGIGVSLAMLGLALAFALVLASGTRGARLVAAGGVLAASAGAVLASSHALFDQLYERLLFKTKFTPDIHFPELVENRSGVINTTADGRVWGGGAYDGAFNTSPVWDKNWIIRAYAVNAMHRAPKEMLMIGLASGSWAQVLANAPGVERFTIVEINPGYLELIAKHAEVASVLTNPKVHIVIDDGRRWLLAHPNESFDVIVMNTSWNWRAHSTNLLSQEFLQMARQHMRPGAILFYNATSSFDVYKTAATVFPYTLRVINFVAVSDGLLTFDKERWSRVMLDYRIDGRPVLDLSNDNDKRAYESMLEFAQTIDQPCAERPPDDDCDWSLEARAGLLARAGDARVITDDNMVTEWRTAFPEVEP